jgi:hypothetical protein
LVRITGKGRKETRTARYGSQSTGVQFIDVACMCGEPKVRRGGNQDTEKGNLIHERTIWES